jgi:hypothetical protein
MTPVLGAGVAAVGIVAGIGLAWWERRAADPILPRSVVLSPRLLGGAGGMAANSALWSVVVFVLAQQLQEEGWSPVQAGLAVVPASAGILLGGFVLVPFVQRRAGSVRTAVAGLLISACCTACLSLLPAHPRFLVHLLVPLLVLGIGLDSVHLSLAEHTLKDGVPGAEAVSAAVFEASTHVGGALSIALFAIVLATGTYSGAYVIASAWALVGALAVSRLSSKT